MSTFTNVFLWACLSLATPASACDLIKVSRMPLIAIGEHFGVMGRIDSVMRPFIVDTGAAATLLRADVVHELGIPIDPDVRSATMVNGIGNVGELIYNVMPSMLAFGEIGFANRSTVAGRMGVLNENESDVAGLLGDDILSQFDVEFDFPHRTMTFYHAVNCAGQFAPWKESYAAGPFRRFQSEAIIDVYVNSRRINAIVDTGATLSFFSRSAATALGAKESNFTLTSQAVVSPLNGGKPLPVRDIQFETLAVGREQMNFRHMGVVDVEIPGAELLLGLDYWRTAKIWISYSTGQIFIADLRIPEATDIPAASGFAAIDDVMAVPGLDAEGRLNYQRFLETPLPRIFVLTHGRGVGSIMGVGNLSVWNQIKQKCLRDNIECRIYAVNDQVVWAPNEAR